MFVIRPIAINDLSALEEFAYATNLGMLSLPRNRSLLQKKIERSLESFQAHISHPEKEIYIFVLENTATEEVGGSSGIYAKSGVNEPLYFFRIEALNPRSEKLPAPRERRVLHPISLSDGPSELCTLYLKPEWRKKGLGELLSLCRFLFIADNLHRFDKLTMAALRGVITKTKKNSPFWDGLGKHFLNVTFEEVQSMIEKDRSFIPDFLPRYPIYVSLLTKQAQSVIGKPHITTRPALKMLKKEGFQITNDIDFLEAGPIVAAQTKEIRTVSESNLATVTDTTTAPIVSKMYVIGNHSMDFRACYGRLKVSDEGVSITEKVAKALHVKVGDKIRYATTH